MRPEKKERNNQGVLKDESRSTESGFIKSRIELNCLFEIILCLTQNQASIAINQLHEVDVESVEM